MIEIRNLTKRFGDFTAVDHLDLTIHTGEFFGLLGPNGAGKTTTISMMSTVLLPTEGEISIDGQPLTRKASAQKRKLSVITQEYSMRQDMTVDETGESGLKSRYFHDRDEAIAYLAEALEQMAAEGFTDVLVQPRRLYPVAGQTCRTRAGGDGRHSGRHGGPVAAFAAVV